LIDSREGAPRKRRAGQEDVEIGRKIRALRLQRGLSQTSLADGIGLTFQQVQKYEKGTNRVSAGRLQKIADLLETPVMFFYGGAGVSAKKRDKRNEGLAYLQTKGAMRLM
jgi:transcriptional regulator with XRE-family HTH domain